MVYILSYFQIDPILKSFKGNKKEAVISLDLGLTRSLVSLKKDSIILPDGQILSIKDLKKIYKHQNKCYLIKDNKLQAVNIFSEKTGWLRTLYPTKSAPATLVSGILMHRIKNTDPLKDTQSKIKAVGKIRGDVLDTATGLGYTAIEAAKTADHVTTVELDLAAIELAKLNPWSKNLFNNPKITQIIGNILEEARKFPDNQFEVIIHDPPTFKIAGELYSEMFYRELFRILKPTGKMFHYIGDPNSKHGDRVMKGVIIRLKQAGFSRIEGAANAFGLVARR